MRTLLIALGLMALLPFELQAQSKAAPAPFAVRVVGTGKPIIFIPGLGCSGEVWNETVEQLSKKYQCHVLTPAGFAGQPAREGAFVEPTRAAIANYIREQKLDHPAIVGHSIGGFMTFLLGITEPDLVGPLISVDGVPCLPALIVPEVKAEDLPKQGAAMTQRAAKQSHEDFVKGMERTLTGWIPDAAKREQPIKWCAAADQATVAMAMGELFSRDLRPELSKIKSRVLLIAAPAPFPGMTKEELQKRYTAQVDAIPNKQIAFAEKSRHFIMYDEPEWMREQIEKFLTNERK